MSFWKNATKNMNKLSIVKPTKNVLQRPARQLIFLASCWTTISGVTGVIGGGMLSTQMGGCHQAANRQQGSSPHLESVGVTSLLLLLSLFF
jgi:hypothetical protein